MDVWTIIPIDPAEPMSTYSALLFMAMAAVIFFLWKQNIKRQESIKVLEDDLRTKEKELREHTDDEAEKLHKRIEKGLNNNSNDLKDVKDSLNRVENTTIKQTSDIGHIIKIIDELKCTIEHMRDIK